MIKFLDGYEIVYPDCVSVSSASNVEYFKYIVLNRAPVPSSLSVKINGRQIPASDYTYRGYMSGNTKVSHNGYSDQPEQVRSGFFIELKVPSDYYKSGDNVEVGFTPAAI